ncbi:MAG: ABC transporter ATP-binding protein [Gemmataceae bacterium]
MMDAVIVCQQLKKSFAGREVLRGLDFIVPRGAITALLGDNGTGKSTTFRILTGQIPADAGQATLLGEDCWKAAASLRRRVGYCPERPRFYDWMSVAEIGAFSAAFHAVGYKARYNALLERFDLSPTAKLASLSKGGYAKVSLALALASDPEVLLLDEPTSGLDLFTRREFLRSMAAQAGEGKTILISSHSVAEVERVVSHIVFLAQGKTLLAGSLEELRGRLRRVRVQHQGTDFVPEMLGEVLQAETSGRDWQGIILDGSESALETLRYQPGIHAVETSYPTLEEMYTAVLARYHRRGQAVADAATTTTTAEGVKR